MEKEKPITLENILDDLEKGVTSKFHNKLRKELLQYNFIHYQLIKGEDKADAERHYNKAIQKEQIKIVQKQKKRYELKERYLEKGDETIQKMERDFQELLACFNDLNLDKDSIKEYEKKFEKEAKAYKKWVESVHSETEKGIKEQLEVFDQKESISNYDNLLKLEKNFKTLIQDKIIYPYWWIYEPHREEWLQKIKKWQKEKDVDSVQKLNNKMLTFIEKVVKPKEYAYKSIPKNKGTEYDAEEVYSEYNKRLSQNLANKKYNGGNLIAYVCRIIDYCWMERWRTIKKNKTIIDIDKVGYSFSEEDNAIENFELSPEKNRILFLELLNKLPKQARAVFFLFCQDKSHKEIAEELFGSSAEKYVRRSISSLSYARNELKEIIFLPKYQPLLEVNLDKIIIDILRKIKNNDNTNQENTPENE